MIVPFLNTQLPNHGSEVDVMYLTRGYNSDPGLVLQLTVDIIELNGGINVL